MSDVSQIFKAYDIRGRVGTELTSDVAKRIGEALGSWLPESGTVAVGRDMRPDSAELANAVADGLRSQGRDVMDIGEVTSDMIYFAVGQYKLAGGAMVTASHNPGEYNGIKLCREEVKPIGEDTGLYEIRDLVISNKFQPAATTGKLSSKDIVADWIQHVLSFIDATKLKPLKIAVDAGNGMAGKIFPALEPHVPWQVKELYFELDGSFPNHEANPLKLENLQDLIKTIKAGHLDGGIAFDGDGDRAVLVDETGEPLSGTVLTAILAQYFLKLHPGATILHNAICGQAAVAAIKAAGGKPVRTRVGHSFIKADMRTYGAVMGGEHSGHYYFKDNFMADSGLIAAVIGLFILSQSGKTLSELAKPFREAFVQIPETNFEVKDKDGTLKNIAESFKDGKQDWLDGLTVSFGETWFNVRPSNTEPLLRLNAEAKTTEDLDKIVAKVTEIIKSAASN
ncbi:MAG TPA: phosphomannomutase/phosphoglucomutase [Candidatus Binatia bacterium]|nr:phosphomannomutase/phosphoglucomutase [Candidatus Binatia bacterium]